MAMWTIKAVDGDYCVVDAAGQVVGIHPTQPDAEAHLYSLYAGVPVKTVAEDAEMVQRTPGETRLKMVGDDRVGGYLVVWGGPEQRDLYGEYFTRDTDLGLDWYDQRPALYHHGLDGTLKTAVIGRITTVKTDDTGLWAEAQFDMRSRYVQKIREMVEKGALGWSSGSLAHLVEVDDDGWIKRWPIVEGSMTPAPAEPRHTQINPMKFSAYKAAIAVALDTPPEVAEGDSGAETPDEVTDGGDAPQIDDEHETSEDTHMDNEMIMSIIAATAELLGVQVSPEQAQQIMDTVMPQAEAAIEAVPVGATPEIVGKALAENTAFTNALKTAISRAAANGSPDVVAAAFKTAAATRPGQSRTAAAHQPMSANPPAPQEPRITVKSEYDALDANDMLYGYMMMKHRKGGFTGVSEQYANALADKVTRAGKSAIKANELSHSTQTSYGDEWVPDMWSRDLWEKARLENKILPLFQTVDMPSNPYELPIEGTDPTVYFVPETTAEAELLLSGSGAVIPDSKIGTGKVQLAAKKLALRVGFSAELVEDSIVPVLSIYRRQAERAIMDSIDHLLLNGDTESGATGNINSDDGAPAATAKYMAFNGLLKAALVTDTTRKYDAGGAAPTLSAVRTTRFKMAAPYAADVRNLAYVVGSDVYAKLLGLDEFLTMDKIGNDATALTGQIGMMDGIPVILSAELAQAEADGKINTASPSSTLFGRLASVHRGTWYVGYRRRIALDVSYLPYYDSYQLTATVRLAFANQNTQGISVMYNLAS